MPNTDACTIPAVTSATNGSSRTIGQNRPNPSVITTSSICVLLSNPNARATANTITKPSGTATIHSKNRSQREGTGSSAAARRFGAARSGAGAGGGVVVVGTTRVEVGSGGTDALGHGSSASAAGAAAPAAAGTCWGTFSVRPHPLQGNAELPTESRGCLAPHSGQSNTGAIYARSCSTARSA